MAAFYQVDSEDAAFLFSERTDNPAHLSLVALYDQSALGDEVVRFQHIVQLVKKHLPLAPVLRQKLKRVPANLGYPKDQFLRARSGIGADRQTIPTRCA